jgi:hypothetical protein
MIYHPKAGSTCKFAWQVVGWGNRADSFPVTAFANPTLIAAAPGSGSSNRIGVELSVPVATSATGSTASGTLPAGTYYYVITATGASGETAPSNEVTATIVSDGHIDLVWGAVSGATGYVIYRSTVSGTYGATSKLTAPAASANTATDTGGTALSSGTPSATGIGYASMLRTDGLAMFPQLQFLNALSAYPALGSPTAYGSATGGSYPHENNGHLVLMPRTTAARDVVVATGLTPAPRLIADALGNVVLGPATGVSGALATDATDGFLYLPVCAGIPTGVPTAYSGRAAMVVDSTDGRLYIYHSGAWHYAALT